jgi:hypothetical protein
MPLDIRELAINSYRSELTLRRHIVPRASRCRLQSVDTGTADK